MTALTRLPRALLVIGAAVLAAFAVSLTSLPPGVGLLVGALAGMAAAAFGSRDGDGDPGPDTPDTDGPDPDADSGD